MLFRNVQHIAIIVSDIEKSLEFYVNKLGFKIITELERPERRAKFVFLEAGNILIELCAFPNSPKRLAWPEAAGLRHMCFEVEDLSKTIEKLHELGIQTEEIRTDMRRGKRYTFLHDPDDLPIEITEK